MFATFAQHETTPNWIWTAVFSGIFCGAVTDLFFNKDELVFRLQGERLQLSNSDWTIILAVIWAEFALCVLVSIINETLDRSCALPLLCGPRDRVYVGWRHLEGLIALGTLGGKCWFILTYTGVDGVVNGLSNAYFGVWGSFFNSVFTFGTWLRENKTLVTLEMQETSANNTGGQRG